MLSKWRRSPLKIFIAMAVGLCLCVWVTAAGLAGLRQVLAVAQVGSTAGGMWWEWPQKAQMTPAGLPQDDRQPLASPTRFTAFRSPSPTPVSLETPSGYSLVTRVFTPSPTATNIPSVTPLPTPTPRKTFNVVFLGTDRDQAGKGTWRTDVTVLTAIDRESGQVGMLALPRDLWVDIPEHEPEKINTVDFLGQYTKYPGGGPALLSRTLRENFGFDFDRFIRVDFTGFVQVIDELGGIDLEVDCPLEEVFADAELPGGRLLKVESGWQHMDGRTALMYVRTRHSTNDTDRSRREFKVLMALRDKALQLDTIPLIPQLWGSYRASVQTDLSIMEAIDLAGRLRDIDASKIHGRIVDQTMSAPGTGPKKQWILVPDRDKIRQAYNELLFAPTLSDAARYKGKCPPVPTRPPS